jgi:hypothetical protein
LCLRWCYSSTCVRNGRSGMHALSSSGVVRQRSSLVGEMAGEVGEGDGFGVVAGEEGGDPLRDVLFAGGS